MIYTKDMVKQNLIEAGFKGDETVLVHSAFSKIKNIEGGATALLEVFKEYFEEGLVILPTHTWASMTKDNDTMVLSDANSCVGYLTNVAIKDSDFVRSAHPTHSVVACGHLANDFVKDDNYATTPVSPNGSFGKLKKGAKIIFLGAPLSKNTFIHSIEEEYNVPDRFTEHIYAFYSKLKDGECIEFKMPKHFSTKHPHLSENYAKLLDTLYRKEAAKSFKFMDIDAIVLDAKMTYEIVCEILNKDLHAFDDLRDVDKYVK